MLPSDLNFGAPLWRWALLAVPMLAALFFWAERQANRRLARLIQAPRLRQQLAGVASALRRRVRYGFFLLGLAGLILTAAQPRWGYETRETHRRGLDLIVIADVSKSMLATDLAPDRLTREKLAIDDLVRLLQGDRLGLVAFAGSAFLQAPLTIDYDAVLDCVAELDTDLIPRGGTNLGGAIDLALEAFGKNEAGNRAILLMTDGEATVEGEQAAGVQSARRAAAAGVRVFTVGFGTPEGSLIPLVGGRKGEFVRDDDGKVVRTRLDEAGLNEIARAGNGFYLRFTSGEATMRTLVQDGLSQLKTGEIDARTARRPIERYQWPLAAALACVALGILTGERRRRGAPAAVDGISPDTIAVPVRRMEVPAKQTAAVAVLALLVLPWAVPSVLGADEDKPADDPPGGNPLELYRQGHYDDAYRAYEDLAKKDPKADALQFNAGASAYMGRQYDEAMDAFGKAMTSNDPALRARSHYNFGNTLFRRGGEQKDGKARIADWHNAIQHYDSTLDMLKRADPDRREPALAANTAYNREFVQKLLQEEERKQQQQQQKDQDKKNQDKKDQRGQPDKSPQGQPQDKSKPDQSQSGKQPSQDQNGSSSSQDQKSQGSQPPKSGEPGQPGQDANQPPPNGGSGEQNDPSQGQGKTPSGQPPQNPSQGNGQPTDSQNPADPNADKGQAHGAPDTSNLPDQSQPRQRGDFQAQPGQGKDTPPPSKDGEAGQESGEAPEQAGKMSQAQAEALLNALKGDDARVGIDPNNKHRRDEPVTKDW